MIALICFVMVMAGLGMSISYAISEGEKAGDKAVEDYIESLNRNVQH